MKKVLKSISLIALVLMALAVLVTCNIFGAAPYTEKNVNGYRTVELISPHIEPMEGQVQLNRLAFGVSSRRITQTALPVPVYADYGVEPNFRPWGNIIMDSMEDNPGFEIDPKKGEGRQIVLTSINETNNAGKIAGSEDGISFYFKEVPADVNFRISADFYIDSYGFTGGRAELNGQEAFGFMARDYVPQHNGKNGGAPYDLTIDGLKNVTWDGVYWNGQDTALNDGISGSSNMIMVGGVKRGTRVYWRSGVVDPDGEYKPVTDPNTIANADFARFDYRPREFSDYSIYGTGIEGTRARPDFPSAGLTYKLYLERTNSGFVAKITPPLGVGKGVTKDRRYVDGYELHFTDRELCFPDMMANSLSLEMYNRDIEAGNNDSPGSSWKTSVNKHHYYVGLFVARDAKVTVTNLKYEESPAALCPPRIDPVPEQIIPTFTIGSPGATSVEDYIFVATSNVEGKIALSINNSEAKVYDHEWIVETTNASARPFAQFRVEGIKLKKGDNNFDVIFMPDKQQLKSGYLPVNDEVFKGEYLMANAMPISRSLIVNRRDLATTETYGANNYTVIWAAPNGRSTGDGTKDNPLDIKTAIAVSSPGQLIMLKDGIYTPLDPPEVINGAVRTPIRLTIPRYNSGLPNNDSGAPEAPWKVLQGDNLANELPAFPSSATHPYYPYNDPYYKYYKVLKAENRNMAIFDFRKDLANQGYASRAFEHFGNYWIFDGFHVRNAYDNWKGFTVTGQDNLIRWVKTYFNGDTGLQISGNNAEPKSMWPARNRVEYCESFGNADLSRTNADGFAAKLTAWEGNVFYRTISHHNIDDGYDLFAKKETGPIGALLIQQSFAYANGRYLNDEMGYIYSEENARMKRNDSAGVGGNGFKMGGEGIPVTHLAIDCLSFGNDGDGFTSNSDPAIRLTHVSAFDNYSRIDSNPGSNFAIYSASSASYEGLDAILTQVLSWRSETWGFRNDRAEAKSPSSGFVWRNYDWTEVGSPARGQILGLLNTGKFAVYDGNNGKDSGIVNLANKSEPKQKPLPGQSVSTAYIDNKGVQLPANNRVNLYVDGRVLTLDDFYHELNPALQFKYVYDSAFHVIIGESKREIFTKDSLAPWDTYPGDIPCRRFDGTPAGGYQGSQIEGDFFDIYQEGDTSVPAYYWGLPNLQNFMRVKDFPGVTPGARGLWY